MVVLPSSRFWQRHEDGLDATACFEAEHRSSIVHQVELHVSVAAKNVKSDKKRTYERTQCTVFALPRSRLSHLFFLY